MWLYVCVCIWTWMSVRLCRLWVRIVSEREWESEIEMYCPSYHSGLHYLGLPSRCVTHPGSEVKYYQGCGQMESLFFRPLISWVTQAGGVLYLLWEEATQILFPGLLNAAEIFFYRKKKSVHHLHVRFLLHTSHCGDFCCFFHSSPLGLISWNGSAWQLWLYFTVLQKWGNGSAQIAAV